MLATFIFSLNVLTSYFIYPIINIFFFLVGIILYLCQVISQFYTALINPGVPTKNYFMSKSVFFNLDHFKNTEKYKFCGICQIIVKNDNSIIHCSNCNICIKEHDHHCNWIGKCIGKNNLVSFWTFIITTVSYFFYHGIILFIFIYKVI